MNEYVSERKMMNQSQFKFSIGRRQAIGGLAALTLMGRALAQPKFSQLKILCTYSPGGSSDAMCRLVAKQLQPEYASSVIVENKAGATGQIGTAYVKQQPADGLTILQTAATTFTVSRYIYKSLPFDPDNDFIPLTVAVSLDVAYAVGPMVPASVRSLNEYLAWVKRDPKHSTVATGGLVGQFIPRQLGLVSKIPLEPVQYKGGAPAVIDTISGNVPALVTSLSEVDPHVKSGKLRLLAVASDKRSAFAPDLPTFAEQGIPSMVYKFYFPFYLRSDTPAEIVAQHSTALRNVMKQKEIVDAMAREKIDILATDMKEAREILEKDRATWQAITTKIGFVPQ